MPLPSGGQEPPWVKAARSAYYLPLLKLRQLETRIAQTEVGQAWLDRLKRLKRP